MNMERLPFERRPRNSIANNLDRINELVDWVNLDTHLYASATGERVTVDVASSVKGLTVDGRSVQDGTPAPDAPVPVQVVGGANLLNVDASSTTNAGITYTVNVDGTFIANGTATGESRLHLILDENVRIALGDEIKRGTLTLSVDSPLPANTRLEIAYYNGSTYTNSRTYIASGSNYVVITSPQVTFDRVRIYFIAASGVTLSNLTIRPMLVHGSTAKPYTPYGSIGIVVGDTATPINLQENLLASLPDGTRDELHIDSVGRVWIEKRVTSITLDGTTNTVFKDGGNTHGFAKDVGAGYPASTYLSGLYNRFKMVVKASNNMLSGEARLNANSSGRLFALFVYDTLSTAQEANTWLTSNPVDVYYPLATPTTIDLGYITPPAIPSGSVVTVSASLTPTLHLEWWVDDGITALVNDLIAYVDYKTEG